MDTGLRVLAFSGICLQLQLSPRVCLKQKYSTVQQIIGLRSIYKANSLLLELISNALYGVRYGILQGEKSIE